MYCDSKGLLGESRYKICIVTEAAGLAGCAGAGRAGGERRALGARHRCARGRWVGTWHGRGRRAAQRAGARYTARGKLR